MEFYEKYEVMDISLKKNESSSMKSVIFSAELFQMLYILLSCNQQILSCSSSQKKVSVWSPYYCCATVHHLNGKRTGPHDLCYGRTVFVNKCTKS